MSITVTNETIIIMKKITSAMVMRCTMIQLLIDCFNFFKLLNIYKIYNNCNKQLSIRISRMDGLRDHMDPVVAFSSAQTVCEILQERMQEDPNNVTDDIRRDFVLASLATSVAACDAAEYVNQTKTPGILADEAHVMNMLQEGLTLANRLNFITTANRARAVANNTESIVNYMMVAANRWHRDAVSVNLEIENVAMRIDPVRMHASDERRANMDRIHDDCFARRIRIQDLHNTARVAYQDVGVGALARRSSVTRCSKGECKNPRRSQGGSRKKRPRKPRKTHQRR
jgi:hypothetical protein